MRDELINRWKNSLVLNEEVVQPEEIETLKPVENKDLNVEKDLLKRERKKFEIEKREQENQKEWNQILGQKEYPENENWFWKNVHKKRNDIVALYKLLFFKQKDVRDPRATFVLISLATMGIFSICKWMLYIFVISIIVGMFKMKIDILLGITLSFVLWMLARIFRMASFEVEKIRDGNLLIAIFSGVLSFVAVIIAIVAIIVDKV